MSGYERYQERLAEAMDPVYWRRRNEPESPALKSHAAALVRHADLILTVLKADGWTPPVALFDAFCEHHDDVDEVMSDEHRANCLGDGAAAARLEQREAQWDTAGQNGYDL